MSKQVNYNENLCAGAAIRDDKGRRISKLFEAPHPKMTVGYAKNLIMPDDPTEQEFNFRQSGSGVIEDGVAVIDKVKGNSVVWNQLANKILNDTKAEKGITMTLENGVFTVNGTITEDGWVRIGSFWNSLVKGHKTLRVITPISGTCSADFSIGDGYSENNVRYSEKAFINYYNLDNRTTPDFYLISTSGTTFTNLKFKVQSIDLTQIYGAGNEPTTYEEFLQRKPKVADEFAYNEGTIVNNKVEKVVSTGANLWDEEWEQGSLNQNDGTNEASSSYIRSVNYIPIRPNTEYYFRKSVGQSQRMVYYDANKNFVAFVDALDTQKGGGVFTTTENAYYIRFYVNATYGAHDICINLSDPTINGKYFPYEKHELDLSWIKDIKDGEGVKLFEDGMKSAGTAFDEVGKNKAVKRLGLVKMKDLNWISTNVYSWGGSFSASLANMKPVRYNSYGNISYRLGVSISNDTNPNNESYLNTVYGIRDESKIGFVSVIQDVSQLIASFTDEDILYYELAEPIEVEYDEKNLTYPVVAGGTEEAIASEPSTAFRADIGYGIDAVKTILDLKARVEALEEK